MQLGDFASCGPFEKNPALAVAVSGGADSMALALLAKRWTPNLTALTVDHGIRPEAAEEARQVGSWLKARGIAHHTLTHTGPAPTSNIQAWARATRYRLMTEWCKVHSVPGLLVAHHRDDQAETFLLRLERGSGVDGLAAMRPESAQNGIRILRPLLSVPKAELIAYLRAEGQDYIEDPSNQNPRYRRTAMRALLLRDDTLAARMADTATHMRRAREALEFYTDTALSALCPDGTELDIAGLLALPEEIALRCLSRLLATIGGHLHPPRFKGVERLYKQLNEGLTKPRTLARCLITPKGGKLLLRLEKEYLTENTSISPLSNK